MGDLEPIYTFIKGKGWVISQVEFRVFEKKHPRGKYRLIVFNRRPTIGERGWAGTSYSNLEDRFNYAGSADIRGYNGLFRTFDLDARDFAAGWVWDEDREKYESKNEGEFMTLVTEWL